MRFLIPHLSLLFGSNICLCWYADAVFATQCGRRDGVSARCSTQLPRDLQPCWLCGGFTYAQHLYESAWTDRSNTVPSHAWCRHRWGGQQQEHWRELFLIALKLEKCSFKKHLHDTFKIFVQLWLMMSSLCLDPNMVNAYMYQAAGTNGQPAPPPGQAPPTTSPPYSNYQPTPSQGYQVWLTI